MGPTLWAEGPMLTSMRLISFSGELQGVAAVRSPYSPMKSEAKR